MVPAVVKDGLGVLMVEEKPSGRFVVTSPHDPPASKTTTGGEVEKEKKTPKRGVKRSSLRA